MFCNLLRSSQSQITIITSPCHKSSEYTGFFFKNYEIKQCCHFLVNKCKIFKMLIETLFLRLFEPDQSEIKEIVQEIVNIHNGAIFKNGTKGPQFGTQLSNFKHK